MALFCGFLIIRKEREHQNGMKQIDFGQVANSYARSREDIPVSLMD